jgi:hypothetical protein
MEEIGLTKKNDENSEGGEIYSALVWLRWEFERDCRIAAKSKVGKRMKEGVGDMK